ncbi:MAG: hypothetical protein ABI920_16330 [Casimicrobiaceae bacterium]
MVELRAARHFRGMHNGRYYERVAIALSARCAFQLNAGQITTVREYVDRDGLERHLQRAVPDAEASGAERHIEETRR